MSPCRVHPGAPRTCRGMVASRAGYPLGYRKRLRGSMFARAHLWIHDATKNSYATYGAHDITNPARQFARDAPLAGVLALATDPVTADRSPLSEGQPE
jgi:hypothetical protein